MSRPLVLAIGKINDRMKSALADRFELLLAPNGDARSAAAGREAEVEGILAFAHAKVDRPLIETMPGLRIVSNYGVGYDSVDVAAAVEHGVMVTHTPDVLNDEVANTTILLLLAVARNFNHDEDWARSGKWEARGAAPLSRSVSGLTAGIVGLGRIGQAIADKLKVFGVDVVYHARSDKGVDYRYYADLTEMAQASDILIVITPGGPETKHLVNARVIEALGPRGILINVARGTVVDEAALIEALQTGKLGAAGLDVFEQEPHIPDALKALPNATLLPHVGSATVETRQAMGDLAVENLTAFFDKGAPVAPVPECRDM